MRGFNGMERYIKTQYGNTRQGSGTLENRGITVTTTVPKGLSITRNSETGLTNGGTKHYPFWDYR